MGDALGLVTSLGRSSPLVLVARPYSTRLRSRVHDMLRGIGLDMDSATIVPSGTNDDDTINIIVETKPKVLLVPFNAHRDPSGEQLDGLTLCGRLSQAPNVGNLPILMPVSRMAAANLRLTSRSSEHATLYDELLRTQIMVLETDDLDLPQTPKRVVEHLRAHRVTLIPPLSL